MADDKKAKVEEKEKKKVIKRKTTKDKWKKKLWYEIYAPAIFDKKRLNETVAEKPELLMGRNLVESLYNITGNPKKAHLSVILKIDNVQGLKAYTKLAGLEVKKDYLRRFVRRNQSKIDCIQDVITKDNVKTRLISTVVCQKKIPTQKEKDIRAKVISVLGEIASKLAYDQL
ncbi:MAG: hypothetical protein Q7K42_02365, partial [Candidatus Diapherotrites archaeon]|nr:hypothetical protein [Candidatus Diapherotrites archaeon]